MNQKIKNSIGDNLGYARCEYSGRTFWKEKTITVKYTPTMGHIFSKEGTKHITDKQLIRFAKQCVTLTIYESEELKNNPKFKMVVER